ncbi:MAG: class I SAM-dependent methyltransferase [bacterium]
MIKNKNNEIKTGEKYERLINIYNRTLNFFKKFRVRPSLLSINPFLRDIQERMSEPTDISSHLETIFIESLLVKPKIIIELGVRDGESTFVFERISYLTKCFVIGVDCDDCSQVLNFPGRIFVQSDSVEFLKNYCEWARSRNIQGFPDIIFIDTNHTYLQTKSELSLALSLVSAGGIVILHDTNLNIIYRRHDGTLGYGWDNKRGVIKAIEDLFDKKFNEKKIIIKQMNCGWSIFHNPLCNGLTIIRKPYSSTINNLKEFK